jgi:hypothetical protein
MRQEKSASSASKGWPSCQRTSARRWKVSTVPRSSAATSSFARTSGAPPAGAKALVSSSTFPSCSLARPYSVRPSFVRSVSATSQLVARSGTTCQLSQSRCTSPAFSSSRRFFALPLFSSGTHRFGGRLSMWIVSVPP